MFTPIENRLGIQPIAAVNVPIGGSVNLQQGQSPFFGKAMPLGTIVRAYDPLYGEGEFIYLQLLSTVLVGSLVTWTGYGTVSGDTGNEAQYLTALVPNTASLGYQVGVAMAAFPSGAPATAFGWFQIGGNSVMKVDASVGAVTAGVQVGIGTSPGIVSTASAGKRIMNALSNTAAGTPAAGFAVVTIQRPFMEPIAT